MRAQGTGVAAGVGRALALLIALPALTGCARSGPAAVAAFGVEEDGFVGVVVVCDEVQTVTQAQVRTVEGATVRSWVGRTVEPITMYRLESRPPDNWVVEDNGELVGEQTYVFEAASDDLLVEGPTFTTTTLADLGDGELLTADGAVHERGAFGSTACH